MGYSTPYIVLNIILLILSVASFLSKRESTHKQIALLSMIVFVVFFCFRGYVQTDTINYFSLFDRLPSIFKGISRDPDYDTGFLVYMGIIKSLGFNYDKFIAISSVIDLILLTILFRRYFSYKYYALYLYLFLIFTGIEYEFNLMRNIKAVLLFLLSIKYIYSREFGKFFILNLIALSFHWTSVLFFPLYFILHKEFSLRSLYILFFVGLLIYILVPYLLNPTLRLISEIVPNDRLAYKINAYLKLSMFTIGKSFSLIDLALMIWYILILVSYNKIKCLSPQTICFINLFVLYFLFSCMGSAMILFRQRVAVLFEPSCWLLFIWMIQSQRYNSKIILYSIIIMYGMLLGYRRTRNDILYEYDNFLLNEKVIPMKERIQRHNEIVLKRKNIKSINP